MQKKTIIRMMSFELSVDQFKVPSDGLPSNVDGLKRRNHLKFSLVENVQVECEKNGVFFLPLHFKIKIYL